MPDTPRGREKAAGAFRTIGEVAAETGIAPHVLRYWETRFAQLRPLQRSGGRRYYRPEDVGLVQRIHGLLTRERYTIRGVQQLLAREEGGAEPGSGADPLTAVRDQLVRALEADR